LIATGILKRTLARSRKEEKDIEKGATVYFWTPEKWRPRTKKILAALDDFEEVIRRLIYNLYATEKKTEADSEIATSYRPRKHEFPRRQDINNNTLDEVGFQPLDAFVQNILCNISFLRDLSMFLSRTFLQMEERYRQSTSHC
jgi:hypothetical protein